MSEAWIKPQEHEGTHTGTLAVRWKDTRVVNLLCNVPGVLGDDTVQRREKGGAEVTVSRPQAVAMYNKFMGGVDLLD